MQFNSLKTKADVEEQGDSLGEGFLVDSDVYAVKIKLAYITVTPNKALMLNLVLLRDNGSEINQRLCVQSGTKGGEKNYYTRNDKDFYLPGFIAANDMALITTGKNLGDLDTEEKTINIQDFESKKDIPTPVPMFTDLLGKEVSMAIVKQTVSKNVKQANGDYLPGPDTKDENEIQKIFRTSDDLTVTEIKAKATEAEFQAKWLDRWKGKIKNKVKKGAKVQPAAAAGSAAPTGADPLFPTDA